MQQERNDHQVNHDVLINSGGMLDSRKMNHRYQDTVLRLIREAGERMKKTIQKVHMREMIIIKLQVSQEAIAILVEATVYL